MSFTKNLFSNFHINSPSTSQRILTSSPSIKSNFQTKTLSKTQIRRVYIAMIQKKFGKSRPLKKQQISLVRRSELSLFSEDLTCPICLDIFVNPVSTTCGHNFCLICYQTVISQQNKSCPCCRSQIQRWEIFQNPSVNRLVCQLIKTLTTDEQVQYKKRQSLCKRKIKRRSVDSKLKVGELVDIKNLQDCWEIGEIIKMSTKRKRIYIQVQSANNDKIYTLNSKSFSIARFGYHTCSNSTTFPIKNYQNYQHLLPQQISQPSIQIDYDQPEILSIGNQLVSNIQILLNGISNLDSKRLRILQDRYLNELLMFD